MLSYLSQNADKRIFNALWQEGFETVSLPPFSALSHPVDTHADMLLFSLGDTIFVHRDYPIEIKGFDKVVKIDEPVSDKYPNDVLLNIALLGKNAFANTKYASKTVLKHLEEKGFSINHISQGYAHCSTCIVSENALITADLGIAEAAQKVGVDVLKIGEGNINLPPYNHGFIGGSCGSCGDKIYFCGSLNYHPDGEKIRRFCAFYGKTAIDLFDAPLVDVGGILFV